ncbi:MAG: flavin reductase family protein [Desulfuromonadaceae bacterium]|nr:flavin reductase family protein [Desulfuromonadaceae bacterium]
MKQSLGAKTLIFPTPVLLVGTYDRTGKANLMNAAWGGVCCSQPPCVAVSLRPATYSHAAIGERKAFTISIPSQDQMIAADYLGIASGRDQDKFAGAGFTPVKSDLVDAPYAAECPVIVECRLLHTLDIGLHTQFVGEIVDVKGDAAVLAEDGLPDILKIRPLVFDTAHRGYYGIGSLLGQAFSAGKKLLRQK